MMQTADKIKALRRQHAMTQEDLAARSGCGIATVQRAETGKRISADSLASIAAAFGVPAAELAPDTADDFEPYLLLDPISTGRMLVSAVLGRRRIDFGFCELDDLDDAKAIEAFHDFCHGIGGVDAPLTPIALVTRELAARDHLAALAERGFRVGASPFEVTVYEVDDYDSTMPILLGQWDEDAVAIRVGRTTGEIERAHILDGLGKTESLKNDRVVYPPREVPDDWLSFGGASEVERKD